MSSTTVSGACLFAQLPFPASAIVLGFLSLLYLAYHWALPRPLPGIPYNKDALKKILGDGAEIRKIRRARGSARNWFGQPTAKHMSRLVQVLAPFTKLVLILSDSREAQDILLRRNKEFDRASRVNGALLGVIPWRRIGMRTADPQFRRNRELVERLMTPHFLNTSMTARYMNMVRSATSTDKKSETTKDVVYVFPKNEAGDDLRAHQTQQEAVGESTTRTSPKLFHMFHNLAAPMREAFALKTSMLNKHVSLAVRQLEAGESVNSALDYMIQRKVSAPKKAGRQPVFDTPSMRDELYGGAQKKLRVGLRAAYAEAFDPGRQPSVAEITKRSVPYLDAVMEILRLSAPFRHLVREAMVDTILLGHRVPKGTQVFLSISGLGFTSPSLAVDDVVRSESSKSQCGTTTGAWDHANPQAFVPEPWLKKTAGPFLSFSTGVRGCFDRRLAYLELQILMTLLLWNFELRVLPRELNTWEQVDALTVKPAKCYVILRKPVQGQRPDQAGILG
ncbi:hypothetical protein DL771_002053 [Monosporascus sp. 5C6A]|nr:hypothetical protein DL771_002053 [Monosporascus sp. 5C6A]